MTYQTKNVPYRIQLDTNKNIFIVIDTRNEKNTATGQTIEQALAQLHQKTKERTSSMQHPSCQRIN